MTLILSEVDPHKGKTHISWTSSGVNVILFNLQGQEEKAKPQPGGGGGVRISNAIARSWVSVLCLSFYELSGPCFIRLAVGTGDNVGVESIMVSDLPVYRRNATSVTV